MQADLFGPIPEPVTGHAAVAPVQLAPDARQWQALAQHPLMRTVSVDRTFWRPLTATQYAQMAAQVPEDFRFLLKCPNLVTDALLRGDDGLGQSDNPAFLSPTLALVLE